MYVHNYIILLLVIVYCTTYFNKTLYLAFDWSVLKKKCVYTLNLGKDAAEEHFNVGTYLELFKVKEGIPSKYAE